jgi:hypothetical protein
MAHATSKDTHPIPNPTPTLIKLNKPPPHKEDEPEVQELPNTRKEMGIISSVNHQILPPSPTLIPPPTQANLAETPTPTPQANITQSNNCELDFM